MASNPQQQNKGPAPRPAPAPPPKKAPGGAPVRAGQASAVQMAARFQDVSRRVPSNVQFSNPRGGYIAMGEDEWSILDLAKLGTVDRGRFERGPRLSVSVSASGSAGPGSNRSALPSDQHLGAMPYRGMMSVPEAHWNVDATHPLYGRYLESWLVSNPEMEPGKLLIQLLQERLRELKDQVRKVP